MHGAENVKFTKYYSLNQMPTWQN